MLGLPKAKSYTVEDVWGHDTGRTKHALHVGVPADGAVLLIVTPYTPPPKPPKSH
jgi:hypothetical protein